jgi:VWFA-related protein
MRWWRAVVIAGSLGAGVALAAAPRAQSQAPPPGGRASQNRPQFRSAVQLTTVTATVTDASGHLVTNLPREQFEVFEDGEPQTITQFTSDRVPVSLAVLLDASDSMYGRRIADARLAIDYFISDLLDPSDEFSLLVFNHQQHLLTTWTDDRAQVAALLGPVRPWGSTAIYDAIVAAVPLAQSRRRVRAALLVLSDGADTASDTTLRALRSALLRTDLFVYAVGIDSPDRRAINTAVNPVTLGEITDQTGGRTYIVHDGVGMASTLAQIAEELNSQYVIGYSPAKPPDGKFHSIRVRVQGGGYHVRARNGYVS